MHKRTKKLLLSTGALASLAGAQTTLFAQSSDAIIDKLVQKGILTSSEADELRQESDKDFNSAYQVKTGVPDWVTSMKFGGDIRGRYENFNSSNPAFVDRNRFRYRLRFGAVATIKDNFEVGFRLTSSEPTGSFGGDPISGNTSFQDNASKKFVFIDQAYGKWNAINGPFMTASFTIGKMENPFVLSDMVFDGDYTPEGAAQQFGFSLADNHKLSLNLGQFVLDEVSNDNADPYLFGAQVRLDSSWSQHISTSLGVSALAITSDESLRGSFSNPARTATIGGTTYELDRGSTTDSAVPDVNRGNSRSANGFLQNNFNPLIADASATYTMESFPMYKGAFPIKIGGEFMHNPAADDRNNGYWAGIQFGKSGKKGMWDFSYRWKHLEGDAWWEELTDSDFGAFYQSAAVGGRSGYGSGTNVEGHILKATYSPFDSFTLGLTYFVTTLIDEVPAHSKSDMGRLQLDAVWKF
ncbi:MAG: putative porin [Verrucomicrobiales bacterium]